jgi:tetratricopeptide (TPR) repeat protein
MSANQQSALASLRTVSPIAARLDRSRDGEDRAADILELWQGTETALRALMGGSSLGGQALIRELRQQELISLGQAYALLEFLGARDRSNRASYRPSDNDVAVVREGFRQLEAGLSAGVGAEAPPLPPRAGEAVAGAAGAAASPYAPGAYSSTASPYAPGASSYAAGSSPYAPGASRSAPGPVTPPASTFSTPGEPAPTYESTGRRIPANLWFIISLVIIVLGAIGAYAMFAKRGNPTKDMDQAVTMMQTGRREAARAEFGRITRDNPILAAPHVFLARLAREDGDINTARRELESAIRLEPKNPIALREMGLILFSTGDYELARRFFVRAVSENPTDKSSQGYLGCALARLNRTQEAQSFLARAGPGVWSSCMQPPLQPL